MVVKSKEGEGTEFRVLLVPVAEKLVNNEG